MTEEREIENLDDELLNRMLQDFLKEAAEHLDQLNLKLILLEQDPQDEKLIEEIFRIVHTLKGSASFVALDEISEVSRRMENVLGAARAGTLNLTASMIHIVYEGLDMLMTLLHKAESNDDADVDIDRILQKLDGIRDGMTTDSEEEPVKPKIELPDSREILGTYKKSYDQLAALKHIVYSSIHLSDPESLAVLFSKQIDERMSAERNAVWVTDGGQRAVEIARDGELVKEENRRVLEIESSEVLKHVIREQLVVWPSTFPPVKEMLPEFESPTLFPIKAKPEAFGFLVVDPEESAEVEVYQFVGQFASMILQISKLHQQVEEQRKELNEMTDILFKQNAHLSSLYHVELDLMKVTDPVQLCSIVVEAVVNDLAALRAAAFLLDGASRELIGASGSRGMEGIDSTRFPVDQEKPIMRVIESGRLVTSRDYPGELRLGPNVLENWIVVCLKGKQRPQGVLVAEVGDEDTGDAVSILANYSGILLDNLMLQEKVGTRISRT